MGKRVGLNYTFASATVMRFYDITAYISPHTVVLNGSPAAATSGKVFPAGANLVNPAAGTGTSPTWSLSGIPLTSGTNMIQVVGEAPSGGIYNNGGSFTINTPYFMGFTSGTATPPTVSITSPTASSTYTTPASSLSLSGTASSAVTSVSWTSNNGYGGGSNGFASGTTNWSIANIPLSVGPNTITVLVGDANNNTATAWLCVNCDPVASQPPSISGTPPMATVGAPYNFTFSSTGSPAPTFSLTAGTLPAGLSLNTTTGAITGTPTTAGTSSGLIVTATNSSGTATSTFSIVVSPANALPTISGTPPAGTVGTAYSFTFGSTGYPTATFSLTAGTLPAGLSLNTTTGAITGTPTTAGTSSGLIVAATNSSGTATSSFSIVISPANAAPTISGTPPAGSVGTAYSFTFGSTGYPAPTFSLSAGTLPAGLSLDTATGAITGTPTTAGTSSGITVTATNSSGTATNSFSIVVSPANAAPTISGTPPAGTVGTAYSFTFGSTGYPAPTFSLSAGTLPAGLSLDSVTGAITGAPTTAATSSGITVAATNSSGTVSTSFSITVNNPPSMVITPDGYGVVAGSSGSSTHIAGMFDSQPTSVPTTGTTPAAFGTNYAPYGVVPPAREFYVDFGANYSQRTITQVLVGLKAWSDGTSANWTYWWASTPNTAFNPSAGDVSQADLKLFSSVGRGGVGSQQWVQTFSGSLPVPKRYLIMQWTGGSNSNGPQEAVFIGR